MKNKTKNFLIHYLDLSRMLHTTSNVKYLFQYKIFQLYF